MQLAPLVLLMPIKPEPPESRNLQCAHVNGPLSVGCLCQEQTVWVLQALGTSDKNRWTSGKSWACDSANAELCHSDFTTLGARLFCVAHLMVPSVTKIVFTLGCCGPLATRLWTKEGQCVEQSQSQLFYVEIRACLTHVGCWGCIVQLPASSFLFWPVEWEEMSLVSSVLFFYVFL